jgi:2,4-dienoyl-CoA reductase-like NADH-dependent reductase (Old Yellow Enzyme family)
MRKSAFSSPMPDARRQRSGRGKRAEAIVAEGKADMVALARAMLDNPHWGWHAAKVLGAEVARPKQYQRAAPKAWPGAMFAD